MVATPTPPTALVGPFPIAITALVAANFMIVEYLAARAIGHVVHERRETMISLGVALGHAAVRIAEAALLSLPYIAAYRHRLFDFDQTAWPALILLFLGIDFLFYWQHRASHRIAWFWATHSVHHSATRLNLTAGVRLGWTGAISGLFLFFLPLAWIGFHPLLITSALAVNLGYQFFLHTELAPRLGPLEWIFNTPAHHRVHHAINEACLDKNFGGVLIVFDRLFGTFAHCPDEPLAYGLAGGSDERTVGGVVFGEWRRLFARLRTARSPREIIATLLMPGLPAPADERSPSRRDAGSEARSGPDVSNRV